MTTETFLEEIRQLENGDTIRTTRECAGSTMPSYNLDSITLRQSVAIKIFVFAFLGGALTLTVWGSIFGKNRPAALVFVLVFLIFLWMVIKQLILDKSRNFNILIDRDGITVGEKSYPWSSIRGTAIMKKSAGNKNYY